MSPTPPLTDPDVFRAQFPVLDRVVYLNAGTEGPVPRPAADAAGARIELELSSGRCGRAYFEELMELAASLRARYAAALGCEFASVALTGSTTDGVNTVLAGLELRPGEEILTTDEEHPGLLAPLARARLRHGITVRVVPWDELAGAAASSTRLIACSHVSWVSGRVMDVPVGDGLIGRVVDPLGGSYYVEALTQEMELQAESYFAQIAEYGGVIEAIESGFFQREIAEAKHRATDLQAVPLAEAAAPLVRLVREMGALAHALGKPDFHRTDCFTHEFS